MRPLILTAAALALTACTPPAPPLANAPNPPRPRAQHRHPAPRHGLARPPQPPAPHADPHLRLRHRPAAGRRPVAPRHARTRAKAPTRPSSWSTAAAGRPSIADRSIMNWIAADLARRGYAVWNIDYRGVDRPGGGYPGTFRDVAAAADALRTHAAANNLDLTRLVAIGHSAGGHLALWLAARATPPRRLAAQNRQSRSPSHHVVSLGGLQDLEQDRAETNGCGSEVIDQLVGPPNHQGSRPLRGHECPPPRPDRRPAHHGQRRTATASSRPTSPPPTPPRCAPRATRVTVRIVPGQGHVELIAPETPAWAAAVQAIAAGRR